MEWIRLENYIRQYVNVEVKLNSMDFARIVYKK